MNLTKEAENILRNCLAVLTKMIKLELLKVDASKNSTSASQIKITVYQSFVKHLELYAGPPAPSTWTWDRYLDEQSDWHRWIHANSRKVDYFCQRMNQNSYAMLQEGLIYNLTNKMHMTAADQAPIVCEVIDNTRDDTNLNKQGCDELNGYMQSLTQELDVVRQKFSLGTPSRANEIVQKLIDLRTQSREFGLGFPENLSGEVGRYYIKLITRKPLTSEIQQQLAELRGRQLVEQVSASSVGCFGACGKPVTTSYEISMKGAIADTVTTNGHYIPEHKSIIARNSEKADTHFLIGLL